MSEESVHVLHVLRTLGFGGMERMTRNVIRGLNGRGIRSSIALLSDEADVLDFSGIAEIHRIRERARDPRPAIDLARLIRRIRPSVVHARNFGIWPEAALGRTLSATRVPFVVSYHGADPGEPPLARRMMVRGLVEVTDRLFAVSQAAKDLICELYPISPERVAVIPNGVDTARFSPVKPPDRATVPSDSHTATFVIGHVGRMFPVKNLPLLLEAGAELKKRELSFEIWIAGDGPESAALVELARALDLSSRVRFLGRVEDVPSLLRSFDVFVLTSDLEGHPNALLEAMSTGLPCIATRVASVPEVLDDGRAGILIAPGNRIELADAIGRLASDRVLREKLGSAARRRIVERFGESKSLDAYEALYRGLAKRTGRGGQPAGGEERPAVKERARSGSREGPKYRIVHAEPKHLRIHLKLLKRFVVPVGAIERYRWLYRDNPQGMAHTWVALEPDKGEVVGFTSIFARAFSVGGERVLGGVGLDAFVRPDHRRRGIAAKLHHASLESMKTGEIPIRFMCGPPVQANYHALLKIGSRPVGQMRYLHLPLTVPGFFRAIGLGVAAEQLESAAPLERAVQGIWRALLTPKKGITARFVDETTPEFDRLWRDNASSIGVIGERDSAFVAWRYLDNPVCTQQVVAVEDRGRLLGWAVLELAPRGALIADNLFPADPSEAGLVLRAILQLALDLRQPAVAMFTHATNPTNDVFTRNGFLRGRSASDFQVMCGDDALFERLMNPNDWFMRAGDLDPESCHWSVPAKRQLWTDPNYVSTEAEVLRAENAKGEAPR